MTAGEDRTASGAALDDFRKAEEVLRDRLFVLLVWRRYDQETAGKMARRKAGEFEDPELAKVLEEREKRLDKERRDKEKEKHKSSHPPKRFKGGAQPYYEEYNQSGGYSSGGRGGHGSGGGYFRGGGNRGGKASGPGPEKKCHLCGEPGHFFKRCPKQQK
jgi:uncharacterized membrane protein YgcG